MTLNSEPSLAAGCEQQHVTPTSYLAAAEQTLTPQSKQEQPLPELYAGQGKDAALRSPRKNMHKKSGSLRVNGFSNHTKGTAVVIERYEDKDGEHLVSIKNAWDGERSMRRRNSELVSGRRAGAGWEKSGYEVSNNTISS